MIVRVGVCFDKVVVVVGIVLIDVCCCYYCVFVVVFVFVIFVDLIIFSDYKLNFFVFST